MPLYFFLSLGFAEMLLQVAESGTSDHVVVVSNVVPSFVVLVLVMPLKGEVLTTAVSWAEWAAAWALAWSRSPSGLRERSRRGWASGHFVAGMVML